MRFAVYLKLLLVVAAHAHSGGTDSQGGHSDRSAELYHFHQGPLKGQSFATKKKALVALRRDFGVESPSELREQLAPTPPGQIRLASFNVRMYSTGSRSDTELRLIADRLQQFDLVAIQELRGEEVVQRTLTILAARGEIYQAIISEPVGRSVTERYAFYYRPDRITPLDTGQLWSDTNDQFIREPFYASFKAGLFDFTLVTIHVLFGDSIGDRRAENALLDDVYRTIQNDDPDEQDVILLGDFNLPPEDSGMDEVNDLLDPLFAGSLRTTISDANLYDNFWWPSAFISEWTGEAGIDHFDEAVFGNDDRAASLAVSDHRPIWATFVTNLPDDD